ncbi:protein of unknown function [Xenorhabdus bovienii]|uniref:Uncharacterized protein n=1 Tax=Xenorhabdus bovienii TaxID=40576 RepID=A0A0B6XCL3_XENBV|nr:protein of unknown function [Xenorhabdus bovienii]
MGQQRREQDDENHSIVLCGGDVYQHVGTAYAGGSGKTGAGSRH